MAGKGACSFSPFAALSGGQAKFLCLNSKRGVLSRTQQPPEPKVEPAAGILTIISSYSPRGPGKSMLARRLTMILPEMTLAEASETTRIYSVAGLTGDRTVLVTSRPFRAPITPSPRSA
jgi:hypothetical protein